MTILTTERLRLEPFTDDHLDGLFALNTDPAVMRYITGRPDTRDETQAGIERVKAHWAEWGYSWWSFFDRATGEIIGSGCIQHLGRDKANPLEIGWRLRQTCWGQGYASEAARAEGHAAPGHALPRRRALVRDGHRRLRDDAPRVAALSGRHGKLRDHACYFFF